jgi:hypothetical protein
VVIVAATGPPRLIDTAAPLAPGVTTPEIDRVGSTTTSVADAERVTVPLAPTTVIVEVPAGLFAATAISIVDVPELLTEGGVNVADAFAGKPSTDKSTDPAKPFMAVTVTE